MNDSVIWIEEDGINTNQFGFTFSSCTLSSSSANEIHGGGGESDSEMNAASADSSHQQSKDDEKVLVKEPMAKGIKSENGNSKECGEVNSDATAVTPHSNGEGSDSALSSTSSSLRESNESLQANFWINQRVIAEDVKEDSKETGKRQEKQSIAGASFKIADPVDLNVGKNSKCEKGFDENEAREKVSANSNSSSIESSSVALKGDTPSAKEGSINSGTQSQVVGVLDLANNSLPPCPWEEGSASMIQNQSSSHETQNAGDGEWSKDQSSSSSAPVIDESGWSNSTTSAGDEKKSFATSSSKAEESDAAASTSSKRVCTVPGYTFDTIHSEEHDLDFVRRQSPYGHLVSVFNRKTLEDAINLAKKKNKSINETAEEKDAVLDLSSDSVEELCKDLFVKDRNRSVFLQHLSTGVSTSELYYRLEKDVQCKVLRIDRPERIPSHWTHTYALLLLDSPDQVGRIIDRINRAAPLTIRGKKIIAMRDVPPEEMRERERERERVRMGNGNYYNSNGNSSNYQGRYNNYGNKRFYNYNNGNNEAVKESPNNKRFYNQSSPNHHYNNRSSSMTNGNERDYYGKYNGNDDSNNDFYNKRKRRSLSPVNSPSSSQRSTPSAPTNSVNNSSSKPNTNTSTGASSNSNNAHMGRTHDIVIYDYNKGESGKRFENNNAKNSNSYHNFKNNNYEEKYKDNNAASNGSNASYGNNVTSSVDTASSGVMPANPLNAAVANGSNPMNPVAAAGLMAAYYNEYNSYMNYMAAAAAMAMSGNGTGGVGAPPPNGANGIPPVNPMQMIPGNPNLNPFALFSAGPAGAAPSFPIPLGMPSLPFNNTSNMSYGDKNRIVEVNGASNNNNNNSMSSSANNGSNSSSSVAAGGMVREVPYNHNGNGHQNGNYNYNNSDRYNRAGEKKFNNNNFKASSPSRPSSYNGRGGYTNRNFNNHYNN